MNIINLAQGSAEWHAHRAAHFNASDAPAMLGLSPYKSRAQLLREAAIGITPETDAATQRRFDDGHRAEALARPLAEAIIGDDLYPVTGSEGKLSASFDGLTMDGRTAFEHKLLNDSIRTAIGHDGATGRDLPAHYRAQMEQQMMVSGADRCLFMATRWDGTECAERLHVWYTPDADMRELILQGWTQFAHDLEAWQPEPEAAPVVAAPAEGFGALTMQVEGRVLACNLNAFKAGAEAFIARLPRPADLQSDQDFADAEAAVKACTEAEARIKSAKDAALAQMADVDAVMRAADVVAETIRAARLALDKAVKAEKEARKAAIVQQGRDALAEHCRSISASLADCPVTVPADAASRFAAAIKGKRNLSSIRDAVDTELAALKIETSAAAERTRECLAIVDEVPAEHAGLFPDRAALCASKTPCDLRNLIAARIAEHQQREAERIERERIESERRAELEAARIERKHAQPDPVPEIEPMKELHCPPASEILSLIAGQYGVTRETAQRWIAELFSLRAAA